MLHIFLLLLVLVDFLSVRCSVLAFLFHITLSSDSFSLHSWWHLFLSFLLDICFANSCIALFPCALWRLNFNSVILWFLHNWNMCTICVPFVYSLSQFLMFLQYPKMTLIIHIAEHYVGHNYAHLIHSVAETEVAKFRRSELSQIHSVLPPVNGDYLMLYFYLISHW